jgi:hypothetical protein
VGADLGVDLQVRVEEPERHPLRAHREVVLGQPHQPGQLATRGGPGVVEPEQHVRRHAGLPAHRRHRCDLGREVGTVRGRPDHVQPVGAALQRAGHVALVRDRHLQQETHTGSLGKY